MTNTSRNRSNTGNGSGSSGKSTKGAEESMTAKTQGWESQTQRAGETDGTPRRTPATPNALAGSATKLVPARVDLADYRRRKFETGNTERRLRYENGYAFE